MPTEKRHEQLKSAADRAMDILQNLQKIKGIDYVNLVVAIYNFQQYVRSMSNLTSYLLEKLVRQNPANIPLGRDTMEEFTRLTDNALTAVARPTIHLYKLADSHVSKSGEEFGKQLQKDIEILTKINDSVQDSMLFIMYIPKFEETPNGSASFI